MTTSRSFAPTDAQGQPPPPVFPVLPFAFMAYAEQGLRDYAERTDKIVQADELWGAEEALGLRLLGEMNHAFLQMMWAPFGQAMRAPRD